MGRGRQKAKQTKVARELKYFTPDTDFKSLERELSTKSARPQTRDSYEDVGSERDDDYEDDDWGRTSR